MLNKQLLKFIIISFVAGFMATILFHQEFLEFLFQIGIIPKSPFALTSTRPFSFPTFISLSFWNGVWGIVGVLLFRKYLTHKRFWLFLTLFGTIFPSLITIMIACLLNHTILHPAGIILMLIANSIWGFGVAFITKILSIHLNKPKIKNRVN